MKKNKETLKPSKKRTIGTLLLATIIGFNAIPIYGKNLEKPIKEKEAVVKEEVIIKPEDKIDDALKAKMKEIKASKNLDEKIPVYVWYTDIDQEEVDEQVEEETGLTREGLDTLGMEEPEKLGAFIKKNTSTNVSGADDIEGIKNYLKKTEKQRKKVKEDTDKFIETRREVSKQEYKKHHKKVQKEMKIDKEQVIYESKYAPMVIAKMSCDEIEKVVKKNIVEKVALYVDYKIEKCYISDGVVDKETEGEITSYFSLTKYDKDANLAGLDGTDVKVGILEQGEVTDNQELNEHWEVVYGIVDGIAPKSVSKDELKVVSGTTKDIYAAIEEMIDDDIQVINCSWALYGTSEDYAANISGNPQYTSVDKWFDHVIYQHNVSMVKSAGNGGYGGSITNPGLAYNIITVGGTTGTSMWTRPDGRGSTNVYGGCCFKPDLIAECKSSLEEGTSLAAPAVTGTIALMLELNPSLAAHPQAIKAILQAGCFQKATDAEANVIVGGGDLRKWQGAGMLDILKVLSIVKNHQYGIGRLTGDMDSIKFVEPPYGASKLNVTLAWLRQVKSNHKGTAESNLTIGKQQDLDLSLYADGSYVDASIIGNSSTEMVATTQLAKKFNYEIEVERYTDSTEPVRYAYAWATDTVDEDYDRVPTEIYYIKSKTNGLYLDLSVASGTNNVLQYTFHGGTNQKWIVQRLNGRTTIKNNYSYDMGILRLGNQYNSYTDYATVAPQQNYDTDIIMQADGSYYIFSENLDTGIRRALAPPASNSTVGSKVVWRYYGIDTGWCLEKVNYRKGDVNTDGVINATDLTVFNKYLNGTTTLWGEQRYLADVNNDGKINATDRTLLIAKY